MNRNEIQELISKHSHYTNMLGELLKSLLSSFDIKFHIVEYRTKSTESIEEKIIRKEISDPNKDITDISGLRIILYYQDDVDKVLAIIKENFIIDKKNSINKSDLYNSNEFGYLSLHSIVSLDSKRNKLPEWKKYSSLKAEIQVRTVLQHSWASISHELTYKKDYEIPKELQRRLFRLASLFELADEQFLKIRDEHSTLKNVLQQISLTDEIEREKINLLTLKLSLKKNDSIYEEIEKVALSAGFSMDYSNDEKTEYISNIILVAEILGLSFIKDLEFILKSNKSVMFEYFVDIKSQGSKTWVGSRPFFVLIGILYSLNEKQIDDYQSKTKIWNMDVFNRVNNSMKKIKNL